MSKKNIKNEYNTKINKVLRFIYRYFLRLKIKNKDISLISSTCNGCVILHDLGIRYNSPFVNLFVLPSDFVKLCENLEYYLNQKLCFIESDKNYPVAKLDDIKIFFYHYKNEKEAEEQWERRKKRVNYNNLYFIFTNRDNCTYEDLVKFDNLKYKNKVVFVNKEYENIKSAFVIPGFENNTTVGKCTEFSNKFTYKRYLDYFDYINWFNNGNKNK